MLFDLHTRLRVRPAPGFPCALSFPEGRTAAKLGRLAPRERMRILARGRARMTLAVLSAFASRRANRPRVAENSSHVVLQLANPSARSPDLACADIDAKRARAGRRAGAALPSCYSSVCGAV